MKKPYTKSAKYFDMLMGTTQVEEECRHLYKLFNKYLPNDANKILDFGVGTGLHAISLSKMGYDVTGLDISKQMVSIAKKKAKKEKLDINFISDNIQGWRTNAKFDAVISMWNVLGYVEDLQNTLSWIQEFIKNNGLFIFDCFNGLAVVKQGAKKTYKGRFIKETGNWIYRDGVPEVDSINQKFNMKYHYILKDGDKIIDEFDEEHKMNGKSATEDDWDIRYICRTI